MTKIELVWIPPGSFTMGAENGRQDQIPMHRVTIKEGFYMGKYEVTQSQWRAVMGSNLSHFDGADLPVESVSWEDAMAFIGKLNSQNSSYMYRLPTEAEWEYAARAETTGNFAGELDAMAWYNKNSGHHTHPVGSKKPNAFGLFDMHGNVWEWCQDWYHGSYDGAPPDGSAWLSGSEQKLRVVRGGACINDAFLCRSAMRLGFEPSVTSYDTGFRVVAVART
jgi:formylglycine-generating enzyme required for sulfatase activity